MTGKSMWVTRGCLFSADMTVWMHRLRFLAQPVQMSKSSRCEIQLGKVNMMHLVRVLPLWQNMPQTDGGAADPVRPNTLKPLQRKLPMPVLWPEEEGSQERSALRGAAPGVRINFSTSSTTPEKLLVMGKKWSDEWLTHCVRLCKLVKENKSRHSAEFGIIDVSDAKH